MTMSDVKNHIGAMPGVIYRIALENFVTYKQVELYPSKHLNVIIGPNGTGKSTFVCAIILGLCGKTSVIGRAKKVAEYVRSGCRKASIEIELYREMGKQNIVITRTFDLESKSEWLIDRKTAREKQVQDLVASMNIQVDNLCQLLPQDRVQDFSKMEPPELLKSTLQAVGQHDKVQVLEELIETRNTQKQLGTRLNNNENKLQEEQQLNDRLKVMIEAMQQRKIIAKQIEVCGKKKLWLEYQELRSKVMELTNDKKEAEKLLTSHKNKMAPLERTVDDAKREITKMEKEKLSESREILSHREKSKHCMDSFNNLNYRIKDINEEFKEKIEQEKQRSKEISEAETKYDKLVLDRNILMEAIGDETKVKMELAELQKPISKTNVAIDRLKRDKMEALYEIENNIVPEKRLYQNRIRNLEDVAQKRLQQLRTYNEDCYQAVLWLRENRGMFQHNVYEPMVLEINFTDPRFAPYLENTVAGRDLMAFTFESAQDMTLFLRNIRKTLKTVNAVCSPPSNMNINSGSLDEISYLGFYTYLVDTIAAPEAIVRFLCKQYSIQRIPIGDETTYKNSGKVPANIAYFYAGNHRLTTKISAYNGAKSSSTFEIRPARLLANNVDMDQLNSFKEQLETMEQKENELRQRIRSYESKLTVLQQGLNDLLTKRKELGESVERVRTVEAQIRIQKRKLDSLKNEPSLNLPEEKKKTLQMLHECVKKQVNLQVEMRVAVQKLHDKIFNTKVWKEKLDLSRKAIVDYEAQLRELKNEMRSVQVTHDNIESQLSRTKTTAKTKLQEAKSSCNNKLPQDPDFPFKTEFESLPGDYTALQEHTYELQTRLDCMDEGDESVIKQYEDREKEIARLTKELRNASQTKRDLENKLNTLKESWLPSVLQLITIIDRKFGDMFARLGCTGEIKLDTAAGEDEFDKYGIGILVGFRTSEELQRLSRHAQSGGERALSVALYLVAMQTTCKLPFRCVDEINQGMDPVNERKMFQLLVAATTQCETSQYFLLTPKLLPNLEYNPQITVHTIMNGKNIMNYKKWSIDKFIEAAANYSQNDD